jgi:hypothetical protein
MSFSNTNNDNNENGNRFQPKNTIFCQGMNRYKYKVIEPYTSGFNKGDIVVLFDKHSNPDYDTCYKAKLVNKRNQSFPFAPYLRLEDLERL